MDFSNWRIWRKVALACRPGHCVALIFLWLAGYPVAAEDFTATSCDQEIWIAGDFHVSYRNYCSEDGDLTALLRYYQQRCDQATSQLEDLKARIAAHDSPELRKHLDAYQYAVSYYCHQTSEKIRTSPARRMSCAKAAKGGCQLRSPGNLDLIQGERTVFAKPLDHQDPFACLKITDTRSGSLVTFTLINQCERELKAELCLLKEEETHPERRTRVEQATLGNRETKTLPIDFIGLSAYQYSATACQPNLESCHVQCPQ